MTYYAEIRRWNWKTEDRETEYICVEAEKAEWALSHVSVYSCDALQEYVTRHNEKYGISEEEDEQEWWYYADKCEDDFRLIDRSKIPAGCTITKI